MEKRENKTRSREDQYIITLKTTKGTLWREAGKNVRARRKKIELAASEKRKMAW